MSQNGTVYQRTKKNHYRPLAGQVGFKSSAGLNRLKNLWKVCKTCGGKFRVSEMGKHQRKYLCLNCQPKLF